MELLFNQFWLFKIWLKTKPVMASEHLYVLRELTIPSSYSQPNRQLWLQAFHFCFLLSFCIGGEGEWDGLQMEVLDFLCKTKNSCVSFQKSDGSWLGQD